MPRLNDPVFRYEVERRKSLSKFKVLDYPLMAPGRCICCGGLKGDRKYIDFGLNIDYYGAVYFCTLCLGNIFEILHFRPPTDEDEKLSKEFKQYLQAVEDIAEHYHDELIRILESMRTVVKDANHMGTIVDNHTPDSESDLSASVLEEEGREYGDSGSESTESSFEQSESGSSESTSKSGSSDFSDLNQFLSGRD